MEDELKRALARNELGRVTDIITGGKIPSFGIENIPEGATVLHVAVILGYNHIVQIILNKAVSDLMINFRDDASQWTPLMYAITNSDTKMAKLLLQTGKCDVNVKDCFEQTALHLEAECGSATAEVSYYLVSCGAQIDIQDAQGITPFIRAIHSNNITMAKYLVSRRCDLDRVCHRGRTALHVAAQHCHEEMLKFLIRVGCSVRSTDKQGLTPLMISVQQAKSPDLIFRVMKHLLRAGSPVNAQDHYGNTALLLAINNSGVIQKQHVDLLLQADADPNISNRDGLTPLWQAVYDGDKYLDRLKIIELLVSQNCELDVCCRGQLLFVAGRCTAYTYETFLSPFELAMDSGFYDAAKLLLVAGAKVQSDVCYHVEWLRKLTQTPSTLQHKCRLLIRSVLGTSGVRSKVSNLPLPEKIKGFLLLHDLFSEPPTK